MPLIVATMFAWWPSWYVLWQYTHPTQTKTTVYYKMFLFFVVDRGFASSYHRSLERLQANFHFLESIMFNI